MFFAYMVAGSHKSGKRGRTSPADSSGVPPEELSFLESYEAAEFERPSVTVDVVLLTVRNGELFTLVVPRGEPPYRGRWALPGGFVHIHEPLENAANRVLRTKCSLENVYVEQLCTFGEPDRDPRMRVISIGYFA